MPHSFPPRLSPDLGPLLDGVEDLRDLVEAGRRLDVSRVFLPLRLADEVADVAPHRRLGDEVDVGVGVGLPALALDDPARLAAAGVVTGARHGVAEGNALAVLAVFRSEEHTSELQSLMRTSYAV